MQNAHDPCDVPFFLFIAVLQWWFFYWILFYFLLIFFHTQQQTHSHDLCGRNESVLVFVLRFFFTFHLKLISICQLYHFGLWKWMKLTLNEEAATAAQSEIFDVSSPSTLTRLQNSVFDSNSTAKCKRAEKRCYTTMMHVYHESSWIVNGNNINAMLCLVSWCVV